MALHEQIHLPALCGSLQDLTNPDFCAVGVFASYTTGAALVFVHQAGYALSSPSGRKRLRAILAFTQQVVFSPLGRKAKEQATLKDCLPEPGVADTNDPTEREHHASETDRYQFETSFESSSICLFDTAIVLSFSWQVAALISFGSTSSIQTSHDVLLVCLTTYASITISLGALCTSFNHIRRHKYRLLSCVACLALCAPVTGLGQYTMMKDDFPKEVCLPFFNDYKHTMRWCFVVLSVVFWATSIIMVVMMCLSLNTSKLDAARQRMKESHPRMLRCLSKSRPYLVCVFETVMLFTTVLVNHYFVPEQVLRAQAGGQLAESHWTFGQIVGMLIWLPVLSEFVFVFRFGPKEGLEGRLPTDYTVCRKTTQDPAREMQNRSSVGKRFARVGTEQFYEII